MAPIQVTIQDLCYLGFTRNIDSSSHGFSSGPPEPRVARATLPRFLVPIIRGAPLSRESRPFVDPKGKELNRGRLPNKARLDPNSLTGLNVEPSALSLGSFRIAERTRASERAM